MRAASGGCADCVRLLIDAGADKDAKSKVRETDSVLMDHTLFNVSFQHFILYVFRQSSVLQCSKCLVVSISLALSKWPMPCPSLCSFSFLANFLLSCTHSLHIDRCFFAGFIF